jgi:hypothetical protein
MNTCIKNRKGLLGIMSNFMDCAVLDEKLMDDICNKEIDE